MDGSLSIQSSSSSYHRSQEPSTKAPEGVPVGGSTSGQCRVWAKVLRGPTRPLMANIDYIDVLKQCNWLVVTRNLSHSFGPQDCLSLLHSAVWPVKLSRRAGCYWQFIEDSLSGRKSIASGEVQTISVAERETPVDDTWMLQCSCFVLESVQTT
eukprot:4850726-Amphidinium_carterae.2